MATTDKRSAANARNAQHSTGPRSDTGKARSSKNAIKHGLTSKDAVLPNEDASDFQEHLDQWLAYDKPSDPAHAAVIERAVSSKWKLDRCTRLETQRLSEKVRHAVDAYDLEKTAAAEEIGRRLIDDPINRCETPQIHDPVFRAKIEKRLADNPAILTRQLQMTAQGVDWLIQRWVELAELLKVNKFWHYPEKFRALWMLGRHPQDVLEDKLVQKLFLACNVAHPDIADDDPEKMNLWDECYQAKMGLNGRPMYYLQLDNIRGQRPADALTAQAQLWEIFTAEITRLSALKQNHLDPIDRLDRASAQERAMFDGSKEGVLLRRYETACEREFHKAIADLMKFRKEARTAPEVEPAEPQLRNEAIAETPVEESVASNDQASPRVEAVAAEPATPADSLGTPSGRDSGVATAPATAL